LAILDGVKHDGYASDPDMVDQYYHLELGPGNYVGTHIAELNNNIMLNRINGGKFRLEKMEITGSD
jgi:hypothetical protein